MKRLEQCRCCGSRKLILYLNLGKQPLANGYHKGERIKRYPLKVFLCKKCFHSQLNVVVDPALMFKNYLYVSGTTKTFYNHTYQLAKDAVKRVSKKNPSVLDIACNDGTQLVHFRDLGCKVYGVDPAENLRDITKRKKIPVIVGYWGLDTAKKLARKFDIITATNVFAHVDRPDLFLKACSFALSRDGVLIIEFPYANKMIRHNEFDTVYHEHLSYFLVNSFATLTKRVNIKIVDIIQTPIHGGSIRFLLKKQKGKNSKKVENLIYEEKKGGLHKVSNYLKFSKNVDSNKRDMITLLRRLRGGHERIIGYGASAKGNTMLNFFRIDLDYIVDDNHLKWGYMTPGRNIVIRDPNDIKKEKNKLNIVVLSWNFFNEIAKKILLIRGKIEEMSTFSMCQM